MGQRSIFGLGIRAWEQDGGISSPCIFFTRLFVTCMMPKMRPTRIHTSYSTQQYWRKESTGIRHMAQTTHLWYLTRYQIIPTPGSLLATRSRLLEIPSGLVVMSYSQIERVHITSKTCANKAI